VKRLTALLLSSLVAIAAVAQQTTPPPPAQPRDATLPQPVEKRLANGLRVVVVPRHRIPLVAVQLLVRTGAAADPAGRDGLAQLVTDVLTKGTAKRTAEEIARSVDALGAMLESEAWWDSSSVELSVMSSNLPKAMELLADVARNASFAEDEVELARSQAIDQLQVTLEQPRDVATLAASRLLFGAGAYGHSASGLPETLKAITRDDLVSFHRAHYRPENAVLVVAGDVKPDAIFPLAETLLGSWKRGEPAARPAPPSSDAPKGRRVVVIDMPDAGQAAVVVARRGIRRTDPAYHRAMVANSVLGGGYSSRLNQEIRIRRGLSYGAGSYFQARAGVGPFIARTETKNESAAEVAGIILDQLASMAGADVAESELAPRKAVLIGEFGQALETNAGIVGEVSDLALHDLPLAEINRTIGSIQAVTGPQVREFATGHLGAADAMVVIAGDASKFSAALRERFGEVEIIPSAELDLLSPALRKRAEEAAAEKAAALHRTSD
jgi:zinc protease